MKKAFPVARRPPRRALRLRRRPPPSPWPPLTEPGSKRSPPSSRRPNGTSSSSSGPTPSGTSSYGSSGASAIPCRTPPENEFYKEYMERVRFADRYFGIGSSRRGCQTERGFYYLVLGKPLERNVYRDVFRVLAPRAVVLQGRGGLRPARRTSTSSSTSPRGSGITASITPGSRGPRSWSSPTSAPGRSTGKRPPRS